ncbi:MAG TPA: hypothetical protein VFD08_06270 [Clostridia bacterium]|nr:hypothetical protein [Clostridia bacterium]
MENRIEVYEKARAKHPENWSKNIRGWSLPKYVALNPLKDEELVLALKEVAK